MLGLFARGVRDARHLAARARMQADDVARYIAYPELRKAFGVKSHLTWEERVRLYELAKGLSRILEIGSYVGASACCFAPALMGASGKMYCIDTWNNDAMSEGARDTWQEFCRNTQDFRDVIAPLRGSSGSLFGEVAKRCDGIELLFVDGDHSYEAVKADWDAYGTLLRTGGTVVFHDWGWAEGVRRVIDEEVRARVSSWSSLPNMWWGQVS